MRDYSKPPEYPGQNKFENQNSGPGIIELNMVVTAERNRIAILQARLAKDPPGFKTIQEEIDASQARLDKALTLLDNILK